MGKDSKGACSIESEPTDGTSVDVVLVENPVNRSADTAPDIIRGLFLSSASEPTYILKSPEAYVVSLLWLPQTDVLRGKTDNVALGVNDTSASTAGADVDTNVVIHMGVQFIVWVCTHLA